MGFWSKLLGTGSDDNASRPLASAEKTFQPMSTTDPNEAAAVVMNAVTSVPELSQQELRQEFEDIKRVWACRELVEGDSRTIERVVAENLARLRQRSDFGGFEVRTYSDQNCAQVSALYASYFIGVRIWKTASGYAACGDPHFSAAEHEGSNEDVKHMQFPALLDELIHIGRDVEDPSYSSSGYLRPRETAEASRHPRARAIGVRLNEIGGFSMMQEANHHVQQELGPVAAQALSYCWSSVGEWLA